VTAVDQSQPLVLIVEDEPKIADLLADYLHQQADYRTFHLDRGDGVVAWVRDNQPDLILLDLMLPGMSGIDICKQVRVESMVPIIMITARVEEIDRLLGLELGADDYICKPFSPREVVARARAVLRRARAGANQPAPPGLEMDRDNFSASLEGHPLSLTPVEFSLLNTLSSHPGRVYSRDQLMNEMYSDYRVVSDRAVDTHIKNLRRKLAEAVPERELVESVYGLGYRFIG
jgi:two-component system response regulator BaeR